MKGKSILLWVITISIPIILTGCFQGENATEESDSPPENNIGMDDNGNVDEEANANENNDEEENQMDGDEGNDEDDMDANNEMEEDQSGKDDNEEKVDRELYLIDGDGMVASQTLELPETEKVAKQAMEYLVKGGPVSSMLPNGFEAVLPEGTEILGVNEDDGTMVVDVSSEFEDYEAENERKILEAMTYTLTQFDGVDQMELWINGYPQDKMPVDGTPVDEGYSRANGINLSEADTVDLMDSMPVTLYYPASYNDNQYTVPITQHVDVEDDDVYTSVVQALIDGPGYSADVNHVFNNGTELATSPSLDDGTLDLEFTDDILEDVDESKISDEVMKSLVFSLTDDDTVEDVNVHVEDVETLYNDDGEAYDEPVSKDTFVPSEKI